MGWVDDASTVVTVLVTMYSVGCLLGWCFVLAARLRSK